MDNVPVHTNASAPAARNSGNHNRAPGGKQPNKLKLALIGVAAAVLLGLFSLLGLFIYRSSTAANIDGNKYQAVFFTNGQVYFGKLKSVNSGYMKLTDIYYLQAQSQAAGNGSENPQQTSSKTSDVQLIKLGNEVHGPDDEMIISKDQILFFENLKKDGKVTDSINKYQSQNK